MDIVFENAEVVVVAKPAGMLTVPARAGHDSTRQVLGTALQQQLQIQIYPVHRLDFSVSGLVLYAKTVLAHRHANTWFERREVTKTYCALTQTQSFQHIPSSIPHARRIQVLGGGEWFEWTGCIRRGKRRAFYSPSGQPSHTNAHFIGPDKVWDALQWEVQPVTGRAHQLRLGLSWNGYPILGDALYGSQRYFADNAIALHSFRLDFSRIPPDQRLGLPAKIERLPSWFKVETMSLDREISEIQGNRS